MRYREQQITGKQWVRAGRVVFTLASGQVMYMEESVTEGPGGLTIGHAKGAGVVTEALDPARVIRVLDADGKPTGDTITEGQLLAYVESAYAEAAARRDTKEEADALALAEQRARIAADREAARLLAQREAAGTPPTPPAEPPPVGVPPNPGVGGAP